MARAPSRLLGSALLLVSAAGCGLSAQGQAGTNPPPGDDAGVSSDATAGGDGASDDASGHAAAPDGAAPDGAPADGAANDGAAADNVAPDACVPTTCTALNINCGTAADGCGGTLSCGQCSGNDTCGGAGQTNVCGCTPSECGDEDCGLVPNGCGGQNYCTSGCA
jgi:hypothetical protein